MHVALRLALIWICVAIVGLCPRCAVSQASSDDRDPTALAIQAELDKLMDPEVTNIQGARIALREPIQEFYAKRGFRAAWSNAHNAEQLRKALADSYEDGLDPADYHLPLLEKLSQQLSEPGSTPMLARSVRHPAHRCAAATRLSLVVRQGGSGNVRRAMELRTHAREHERSAGG